jgi:hypothetical protein
MPVERQNITIVPATNVFVDSQASSNHSNKKKSIKNSMDVDANDPGGELRENTISRCDAQSTNLVEPQQSRLQEAFERY